MSTSAPAAAPHPLSPRMVWLGMVMIWLYWTSFFWLALVSYTLRIKPPFSPWVVATLDAFTWQPLILVGTAAQRVLRYPDALFFHTPEVGAVVGATLTSCVWWVGVRIWTRTPRKLGHTHGHE